MTVRLRVAVVLLVCAIGAGAAGCLDEEVVGEQMSALEDDDLEAGCISACVRDGGDEGTLSCFDADDCFCGPCIKRKQSNCGCYDGDYCCRNSNGTWNCYPSGCGEDNL